MLCHKTTGIPTFANDHETVRPGNKSHPSGVQIHHMDCPVGGGGRAIKVDPPPIRAKLRDGHADQGFARVGIELAIH